MPVYICIYIGVYMYMYINTDIDYVYINAYKCLPTHNLHLCE